MRRFIAVVRGAAAILLVVSAPAALAADSPWLYGIHWYGDPNGSMVETMTGGKGVWSLEIVLPYSDPWWQAGGQLWKFQQVVARGHTIICRLEPNWGYAVPQPPNTPDLTQYVQDVTAAAQTLSEVVHIWQIGNEMNLYGEWGGSQLTPAAYVDAFRQIRAAIKSVSSPLGEQIVLLGPVSPGAVESGTRHTAGTDYLGQMIDQLAVDDLDGFAIHAYAAPWNDVTVSRHEFQAGYTAQLAVMDDKGFGGKPVYLTEWNRRVDPIDSAHEAVSAQFLHGAFSDLAAWNALAGAHPIAGACWFIYAYDDQSWKNYSIAYLHGTGPSGMNNDLWDAFQYAATLNLPAAYPAGNGPGLMADAMPPGVNVARAASAAIADSIYSSSYPATKAIDGVISAASKWTSAGAAPWHWLMLNLGQDRKIAGFVLRHAGAAGEDVQFNTKAFYFQTGPTLMGPWSIQAAVFNQDSVNSIARTYYVPRTARYVRLFISEPGIDNYARIPEFEVYAITPGDLDANGDVDLADFARFQDCYRGTDVVQHATSCVWAHFDEDDDVDLADFAGFAPALTGPR